MEDANKSMHDCNCRCENCMKGDHEHCLSGTCTWKKADEDSPGI